MNTTFKAKLLQHLNQKKQQNGEQGFTLIELLVVIIIIGILAAIALPSFLNQANKAKQAEAKQYASSVNKAQQAYYTEKSKFLTQDNQENWGSLGVGIATQTTNYEYHLSGEAEKAVVKAKSLSAALKGVSGSVYLVAPSANADKTSIAKVCIRKEAGTNDPEQAALDNGQLKCNDPMEDI